MKKKTNIILMIVAACIVTGGTAFGIVIATTWGEYEYENSYYYKPGVPLSLESLDFYSDIGKINIKYNTTPTDYYVQTDLDIKIVGGFVAGKNFSDFFHPIEWLNNTSPISFKLDAKTTPVFIFGLSHRIIIDVTLRTDVVYSINAFSSTGEINMNVPNNVIVSDTSLGASTGSILLDSAKNASFQGTLGLSTSTGDISLYAKQTEFTHGLTTSTSTGSILLNFSQCIIGDNLIGTVSTGGIKVKSYNMIYMKDCNWNFHTNTGNIDIQILQYIEMNTNITGNIWTSTGRIDVLYDDSLSSVGSQFACSVSTGSITYNPLGVGGMSKAGGVISSFDYNYASNRYSFDISTATGNIKVLGQSL